MSRVAELGNDLYTGKRSVDFVGKIKTWAAVAAALLVASALALGVKGLNFGLEFTGGSEFRVATSGAPSDYETRSTGAVREVAGQGASARVSTLGGSTVRVQTEALDADETREVSEELARSFGVKPTDVSSNLIGPSWGASVSKQALRAMIVFLAFSSLLMAFYFRHWKMAVAAMVALAHDMVITAGIYVLSGFEVSPATMIGFLTVLGYSLYDTVIVFDKVRENTGDAFANRRTTFAEAANLAVNQTLVRSINTSVIAILPIIAVLVIGFAKLGPGTLLDLSLVLFIGMTVGAISSIFIATPLLVWLRRKDEDVVELDRHVAKHESRRAARRPASEVPATERAPQPAAVGTPGGSTAVTTETPRAGTGTTTKGAAPTDGETTVTGRKVHKYAQGGPRNQPKRQPKSRRGR